MINRPFIILAVACVSLFSVPSLRAEHAGHRPPRSAPLDPKGSYTVFPNQLKQLIKGSGFEIQSDSIASGNAGLPDGFDSVPHDLEPTERERFCKKMLRGFRYCRLVGGLYWQGLDVGQQHLQARCPPQLDELREMIQRAGVEGVSFEYWSPAPYWKVSGTLAGQHPGSVQEEKMDEGRRILAFKRPDHKLVLVLSNRSEAAFKFDLKTGLDGASFTGYRYTPENAGENFKGEKIGVMQGASLSPQVADRTWEFWIQN